VTLQLVSTDSTPLPPLFAHLRLVEAQPDLEPIYISIPAPAVQVRTDGGYDIYPGSFFPGQVDKIRNHPHPQTPDAIMALETFLIGGVGPTLPGATFTGNVTVNSPAAFIGNGSVPPGGAVGQVLTKTGAGDYAVAWQNASGGGLTLPLTQNLTFSPSATWNIGDNTGGLHPYRIFAESDLVLGNPTAPDMQIQWDTIGTSSTLFLDPVYDLYLGAGQTRRWWLQPAGHFVAQTDNTYDIGAPAANRPRNVYAGTSFVGPGAVPTGGTAGQVLSKVDATNYNLVWTTPGGGVTWPLYAPDGTFSAPSYSFVNSQTTGIFRNGADTIGFSTAGLLRWAISAAGHLVTPADNTYDIGQSGATRPRDLWLGRNLAVAGTSTLTGTTSVGGAPQTHIALYVVPTTLATANQYGTYSSPIFSSAATTSGSAIYVFLRTAGVVYTMATGYAIQVAAPSIGAGSTATTVYGINVANQGGASRTSVYGVYIAAQSGASTLNIGLFNAGSTRFDGPLDWNTDNTYDIGASGANRPRTLYAATSVQTPLVTAPAVTSTGNLTLTAASANYVLISGPALSTTAPRFILYDDGTNAAYWSYGADAVARNRSTGPWQFEIVGTGANRFGAATATPLIVGSGGITIADKLWLIGGAQAGGVGAQNLIRKTEFGYASGTTYGAIQIGTNQSISLGVDVSAITGGSFNGNNELIVANTFSISQLNAGGTDFLSGLRLSNGVLTIFGTTSVGGLPPGQPTIKAVGTSLSIDSQSSTWVTGAAGTAVAGNAYFDGTNWQRYNTGNPATLMVAGPTTLSLQNAPAGANPITWTQRVLLDAASGKVTLPAGTAQQAMGQYVGAPTFSISTVNTWTETPIKATITSTGALLRIEYSTCWKHSAANATCQIGLGFDGTVSIGLLETTQALATASIPYSGVYYTTLPAGSHTVAVWMINNSTGTLSIDNGINSTIYVTEQRC